MIALDLNADSLTRIRLAMSPAFEVASWLSLVATGRLHPILGDLGAEGRDALSHPDVRLLTQVVGGYPTYLPDFLTPKPTTGRPAAVLRDQLTAVAETPDELVRHDIAHARLAGVRLTAEVRAAVDDGTFARRAADGLEYFWRTAMIQRWPELREVLEGDLAERGRMLADGGIARLLRTLSHGIRWDGEKLRVGHHNEAPCDLGGAELVLAPTVLGWPQVFTQLVDPANAVVLYPVTRAGEAVNGRAHALDELLGESRAAVLLDLDRPRTGTELSVRRKLAPATVSYHLGVLMNAGLVLRKRDGRRVLYARSAYGDLLLEAAFG